MIDLLRVYNRVRRERAMWQRRALRAELRSKILLKERDEARATVEALAWMVPDRKAALAVVRTQHQISQLPETQP